MENIVLIIHILTALAIVALILMQQGKGASAGASFGAGASQTVFGSEGSGNFFSRATAVFAFIFFCTSFGLAIIAKNSVEVPDESIPTVIESGPAGAATESDVPPTGEETSDVPSMGADDPASEVPSVPAE